MKKSEKILKKYQKKTEILFKKLNKEHEQDLIMMKKIKMKYVGFKV